MQQTTCKLQQTYITTAVKVARKWAAPRLSSGTCSVRKRLTPLGLIPSTGRYAVIDCKFPHNIVHAQYYANEGCKTCASLAGLRASFIVVVEGV